MTWPSPVSLVGGILLPDSVLQSEWFSVLAGFVAVNTLVYVTLSVGKMLPKAHPGDWWHRLRGGNRRSETRSIYPDGRDAGRVGPHGTVGDPPGGTAR